MGHAGIYGRARRVRACVVAFSLATATGSGHALGQGLHLDFEAPPGCPTVAAIEAAVSRVIGRPVRELSTEWSALRATITREGELWRLHAVSALAALDELDRISQSGGLVEERRAVRAMARCQSGRAGDEETAAARRFPGSVHIARLRAVCTPKTAAHPETEPNVSSH